MSNIYVTRVWFNQLTGGRNFVTYRMGDDLVLEAGCHNCSFPPIPYDGEKLPDVMVFNGTDTVIECYLAGLLNWNEFWYYGEMTPFMEYIMDNGFFSGVKCYSCPLNERVYGNDGDVSYLCRWGDRWVDSKDNCSLSWNEKKLLLRFVNGLMK